MELKTPTDRSGESLLILASICLAALVLPLSFTGGAVATPAIGRSLGGTPTALTWITNAFMLSFGSLLMAAGALADQFGRKRVFSIGLALFTLTSLALSVAPSVLWLDWMRAIQGVGAAAALSSGSAALAQEFEGHARTRAFSALGATFGIGLAFGPLVAGTLIEFLGWQAVFLTTAALGMLAMLFGLPRMRETRDPGAQGLDWPGTITFSGTLALLTFGLIQAPESGWSSPLVVGLLAGAGVLLVAFVVIEAHVARPMLDLSLFRLGRFVGVQMLPIGTCYSFIVLVVMLPLRLIGIERMTELEAGLLMVALSLPVMVVPFVAASLTRYASAGVLSGLGFLIAGAGLHWLSYAQVNGPLLDYVLPMFVIGLGSGLPWGLMDGLAISVVPVERAGMATGIFNTARVAGEGITLAIVSAVLAGMTYGALVEEIDAGDRTPREQVVLAARRLTTGDLEAAQALLPQVVATRVVAAHDTAFHGLIHVLTGVTLLAAVSAFGFLGGGSRLSRSTKQSDASPCVYRDAVDTQN